MRELEKKYADSAGGEGVLREQITEGQYMLRALRILL
ncbi:hypothetical protein YYY_01570 [Anaplasma phagocytophilum str. Dog2]|nr:hypothetical protein YYY_01570 [Anaplasma phagocytophilum str. Dog2]